MNYLLISDIIWYGGHILTGISILFTQNNFYVAVSLVAIGQFITMISRPIGRITNDEMKEKNLDFV
jgi:hypothetical protein